MENLSNNHHGNNHDTNKIDFQAQDKGAFWRILKQIFINQYGTLLFFVITTAIVALIITSIGIAFGGGGELETVFRSKIVNGEQITYATKEDSVIEPLASTILISVITFVIISIVFYFLRDLFFCTTGNKIGYIKKSTYYLCFITIGIMFIFLSLIAIGTFILLSMNVSFKTGGEARVFEVVGLSVISIFIGLAISNFATMYWEEDYFHMCPNCKRMYAYKEVNRNYTGEKGTYTTTETHWVKGNYQEWGTLTDKNTGASYTLSTGHKGYFDTIEKQHTYDKYITYHTCINCGYSGKRNH